MAKKIETFFENEKEYTWGISPEALCVTCGEHFNQTCPDCMAGGIAHPKTKYRIEFCTCGSYGIKGLHGNECYQCGTNLSF